MFFSLLHKRTACRDANRRSNLADAWDDYPQRIQIWEQSLPKLRTKFSRERLMLEDKYVRNPDSPAPSQYGIVRKAALDAVRDNLPSWSNILVSMHWRVLKAPTSTIFITSDNPVIIRKKGLLDDRGIVVLDANDSDVELHVPLSPRRYLIISVAENQPNNRASKTRVRELNRMTARFADKWVFTSESSASINSLLKHAKHLGPPVPKF